jgi:hypothetical protein
VKRQVLLDTLRSIDAELRGTDNGVQHAARRQDAHEQLG